MRSITQVSAIPGIQAAFELAMPEGRVLCPDCGGAKLYRRRHGPEPAAKADYAPCCTCAGEGHVSALGLVQTCPARMNSVGPWECAEGLDRWEFRGQDLVCSFCGSMHPARFRELVLLAGQVDSPIQITAGKAGKFYISQPSVPNATVGGIKFYTYHYEFKEREAQRTADEVQLRAALQASSEKLARALQVRAAKAQAA